MCEILLIKKKMKKINNKKREIILAAGLFIGILLIGIICAQTWPAFNVCCEKTKAGAWCQNTIEQDCDISTDPTTSSPLRKTPTSCDATSFCKMGCCVDSDEGLCMRNTPQKVCELSSGTWFDDSQCNIAQCRLGCCILGDQASFVTLTRCKKLSGFYGLKTNFKKEVTKETECIKIAYLQDKGACVYESDGEKSCKFTTRTECLDSTKSKNMSATPEFFKDFLCSADELGTNCGPTTDTVCIAGKDEVYFKDSCGNPANIYDSNRIYAKDPGYWKKVVSKIEVCGANKKDGNINSRTCGNCRYLDGSLCGKGNAVYGDYVCKDLNCYNTQNGNSYKNGESWCEYQGETGEGRDAVGTRYFRHVCVHGEETIEPCADFRNEICIEEKAEGTDFTEAACRVNRWKDCIDQQREKDCLNTDKRDCRWVPGFKFQGAGSNTSTSSSSSEETGSGILNGSGVCLPNFPPGLKFWESGDAKSVCSLGNSKQIVTYETSLWGTKTCKKNCEVLKASWPQKMNELCISLGDCGAKANLLGVETSDGVMWKINGKIKEIPGLGGLTEEPKSETSASTSTTSNPTTTTSGSGSDTRGTGSNTNFSGGSSGGLNA